MGGTFQDRARAVAVEGRDVYTVGFFNLTADFDPGEGTFNLTSAGATDAFVSKFTGAGNFVWAGAMGGICFDSALGVAVYSGSVYTVGRFLCNAADFDPGPGTFNLTSAGSSDGFVSKLDSGGNFIWARAIGGTSDDEANGVALDDGGNVYTAGFFSRTVDFDPGPGSFFLTSAGGKDIFASKLDSGGNFVWARAMGGTSEDQASGVALAGSRYVCAVGTFRDTADFNPGPGIFNLTSAGGLDIFVSKLRDVRLQRLEGTGLAVFNAASLRSGSVAPGEIIFILGSELGPAEGAVGGLGAAGQLLTGIAGTEVLFDGAAAPLFFVREDKVTAQVPYDIGGRISTRVQIVRQGDEIDATVLPVTDAVPGLFTMTGGGGQILAALPDGSLNSRENPVAPGGILVMYATGEGQTDPPGDAGILAGAPLATPVLPVSLKIGGQEAEILYAGSAPGFAGLTQINARVPEDAPTGADVPIVLCVGDSTSQDDATVAIGP